jgi:D-mannonate dehydratase
MIPATTTPQSCYPEEIETLREMLEKQMGRLETLECCNQTSSIRRSRKMTERRIEALETAIEALGGAL